MFRGGAILLGLAGFLAAGLYALEPDRLISQYHKQVWQVEDGLPHNYVTALLEDDTGFLLVGTDEGLARFDGLHFLPFEADRGLHIPQRWVSALLRGEATRPLWIGTFDGSLIALRDGKVAADFGSLGSVFDLLADGRGGVWASTRTGVVRSDGRAVRHIAGLQRPPDTGWNVLAPDASGGGLAVTVDGLFHVQGDHADRMAGNNAEWGQILTVASEANGTIWLGTTRGLFRFARQGGRPAALAGVPGPVVAILRDRNGTLWAGTWGRGLYRITSRGAEGWSSGRGLPEDFVRTLFEDKEGDLWIGSRGGLTRWKDSALAPLGVPEGLTGDFATTVNEDPKGDLWLGTWRGGLYRLHDGHLQPQPSPVPTLFFTVRALAFDGRGNTWIGNWEGLYRFDGARYQHYGGEADSPYQHVSSLLFNRRGALWIGTSGGGLFRFANGTPEGAPPENFLAGAEVSSLAEDREGRLWVGTNRGVGRVDAEGKWEAVSGLPQDSIQSVSTDEEGRVWACTLSGTLYLVSPRAVVLDQASGLPGYALYRLVDDHAGSLWVSSARGVLQIRSREIAEVLKGARRRLDVTVYGQEDGMRTIECHGLSQPAGNRARDGSVWFGTAKGFVQIRPYRRPAATAPQVTLEQIGADGRLLAESSSTLAAGARNVEVQYTAVNLSAPGKVQFRYRMDGFDPDWVEAHAERVARYNRLPPGNFTFLVEARNPNGNWSAPASLAIRQLPQFYQTWWFAVLVAAALAGMAGMGYRRHTQVLRARYEAVLSERNRIAREWHDTLVAGFSAISLQLEAIKSRLTQQPERAGELIELTRSMVHHYRSEARRVIWDLRDSRPDSETLPEAVSNALHQATDGRDVEGSLSIVGEPVSAPRELEHNVLRICQEALSNAVRHGEPRSLRLELEYTPAWLLVRVRDDGAGFEPDRLNGLTGHFGLTVMRERARRFGGTLRLESRPGDGTIVEAKVPLQAEKE